GGAATGAGHAPPRGLEFRRDRCAPRHPRERGENACIQRNEAPPPAARAAARGRRGRMSAPDPLRRAVARDLRPVRPLAPPFRRALLLAPLALAIVAAVPLLNFFRSDM